MIPSSPLPRQIDSQRPTLLKVTYSAFDLPFADVISDVASAAGVSLAVQSSLNTPVSVEFNDVPGESAIEHLSRLVDLSPRYDGDTLTLVPRGGRVDSMRLITPGYEDPAQVMEAARSLLGTDGVVQPLGDRLLVGGVSSDLDRMSQLSETLDVGPDGWIVELQLVQVSEGLSEALGLDWTASGELVMDVSASDAMTDSEVGLALTVGALAEASRERDGAALVTSARLLLLEGRTVDFRQGDQVPIRQRTVSPEGTVTDTDVRFIDVGFSLSLTGRRVSTGLLLDIRPELSSVVGFIDGAPRIRTQSLTSTAVVKSGQWVLLTGFDSMTSARSRDELLPFGLRTNDQADTRVVMLLRAQRVQTTHPNPPRSRFLGTTPAP